RLETGTTTLRKTRRDVEVNLSAIAKGYGVDVVFEQLRAAGFADVFVEIGGEVRVSGHNPRGEPWRVGINVPRSSADPTAVLVAVPLNDRAIATSGDYRNFFEAGGRRYSHIIDPQTAAPVEHDLVSVSVLAADCATADGLATALSVLGEERGRVLLASFPGTEALFVRGVGNELEVTRTAGFPHP
ncbi:MAG: FAD:protein FMN transferase, partial [Myxococcota bacterium]